MRWMLRAVAGLAALPALWACETGPSGPGEEVGPGSLAFAYTGGLPGGLEGGSFAASGAPSLDGRGRPGAGPWVVGGAHPTSAELVPVGSKVAVVAYLPTGSREGTMVVLTLPRLNGPIDVTIDDSCVQVGCARALLLLGVGPRAPHSGVDGSCELGEGVVHVTAMTATRVQGTFAGRGKCVRDVRTGPLHDLVVTGGRFEVEISEGFRSGLRIWA